MLFRDVGDGVFKHTKRAVRLHEKRGSLGQHGGQSRQVYHDSGGCLAFLRDLYLVITKAQRCGMRSGLWPRSLPPG